MTLGGRISLARENINLTDQELSVRLGVMVKTVRNWEADRSEPRGNKMTMLSGVLGVPFGWLVSGENTDDDNPQTFEETKSISAKIDQLQALNDQTTAMIAEIKSDLERLQNQIDQD